MRCGPSLNDLGTGMWATIGILAALIRRSRTGEGCLIETSLFETALCWGGIHAASYLASGEAPRAEGASHPSLTPYGAFETAERRLIIGAGNDRLFAKLARALGHPEWAEDARFRDNRTRVANRAALTALINGQLTKDRKAAWVDRLEAAGVPCAPIQSIPEALSHAQTAALGIIQRPDDGSAVRMIGMPLSFDGERPAVRLPAPSNSTAAMARGAGNSETRAAMVRYSISHHLADFVVAGLERKNTAGSWQPSRPRSRGLPRGRTVYHSYLTGLILMLSSRAGPDRAAEVVFWTFRRQQFARFVPGLKNSARPTSSRRRLCAIPLSVEPGSRREGRVRLGIMTERPRCDILHRARCRRAPRSAAFHRRFRAQCCEDGTPTMASFSVTHHWALYVRARRWNGQPRLEGYYKEWDHELARRRTLTILARGNDVPHFVSNLAPRLPETTWPEERLQKSARLCDGIPYIDRAGSDCSARPGRGWSPRRRCGAAGRNAHLR